MYIVLSRKDVCPESTAANLGEIAGTVLSKSLKDASRRPTIQEIMTHNRHAIEVMGRSPTLPTTSKDLAPIRSPVPRIYGVFCLVFGAVAVASFEETCGRGGGPQSSLVRKRFLNVAETISIF